MTFLEIGATLPRLRQARNPGSGAMEYYLGIDAGGTHTRARLVTADGGVPLAGLEMGIVVR